MAKDSWGLNTFNDLLIGSVVYDDHVAFWGSCFSNFFHCRITIDGWEWGSSEQYYMYRKAKHFNDTETMAELLDETNPKKAKQLGRKVKGFDTDEWTKVSYDIMHKAVYEKFSQNRYLKETLLDERLDGKHFVEGSPEDCIWGVGIRWDNPDVDDETKWKGKNWLGKILDEVREELR